MTVQNLASLEPKEIVGPLSFVRRTAAGPAPAREALLIVDDNDLNRQLLSRRFRMLGFEVTVVDGGRKALELIAAHRFDAVLLDVMMPGFSGLQVLEEVRKTWSRADLPIIMATALDQTEDIVKALRLGANDYVSKPFDFEVVFARLETQLSLKRAKAEVDRLVEELEIKSRFIQKTFGRYLRDDIVATLLESPDGLRLGGELRQVTLLMSDLRGFTQLTEGMPPERVMTLLNTYLGAMARIISDQGGMIDEFIGDGILAVFGAPTQRDDDACRAAVCALEMQLAMSRVNAQNAADGLPALEMGIALHAGSVVVGNIGSEARAKYGVVGSNVNLVARIESCTVGGQVLISESARCLLGAEARLGAAMTIRAKGFKDPITVHDLLAMGAAGELALPARNEEPVPLDVAIPITFSCLTDKHVDALVMAGEIVALSPTTCDIRAETPPAPLSNLRACLREEPAEGEIYGKVMAPVAGSLDRFRVRFTSIDAATAGRLRDLTRPLEV